jgi:hypothetical protein
MVTTGRRPSAEEYAVEDNAMKRRVLQVVVLLSCAILAAVGIVSGGLVPNPGAGRSCDPGLFAPDLDVESRELDRQLHSPRGGSGGGPLTLPEPVKFAAIPPC